MGYEEIEFLQSLGNRVRDYRKALGMSQEQLAEFAAVHPTHISNVENGKANASIVIYRRIANALQVTLPQLIDIDQPKVERDELLKAFTEVRRLSKKEQRMFVETIRGLLAGIKQ